MSKILVALDGSSLAEKGFENALVYAKENPNTELVLITILSKSTLNDIAVFGDPNRDPVQQQMKQSIEEIARQYLENLVTSYKTENAKVQVVLRWGNAAEEIVRYAEENKVDSIFVTTRGRSGIKRFLLGSVAARIIAMSTVPVTVYPPDREV